MSCTKDKKKRTKNTSNSQYEIYLHFMENDYCFRSGTINPTLDENYLNDKWKELTIKLNACGDGPALSVEEWQRRFRDWKYSTKAKYRKLHVHRLQTGAGPPSDIKISDVENRGLSVWGKATVTGAPAVTLYEGVDAAFEENLDDNETENNAIITNLSPININMDECEMIYSCNADSIPSSALNDVSATSAITEPQNNKIQNAPLNTPKHKKQKIRPTPLSELAANLSNQLMDNNFTSTGLNNILQTFCENYINNQKEQLIIEKEKLQLKEKKLNFEIDKYKYENKDFQFS